jgi:hypothetical protein
MSNELTFDTASIKASETLALKAAAVIAVKLENTDDVSIADAVRVFEATHKRLGAYQKEQTENLPTVHWNIIGGTVSFDVTPAPSAAPITLEMVEEVPKTPEITPESVFTMDFSNVEAIGDDL